jgi:gluconokinase
VTARLFILATRHGLPDVWAMPAVPGLRSSYAKVGRLVYFGRMIDKIRLQAASRLPVDYHKNLGVGFDGRCCTFLRIAYPDLRIRVLAGGTDEDILAWAHEQGGARSDDECMYWNFFLAKRGWRDEASELLQKRLGEYGLVGKPIETWFDLNDFDEGRDPVADRAWEKI